MTWELKYPDHFTKFDGKPTTDIEINRAVVELAKDWIRPNPEVFAYRVGDIRVTVESGHMIVWREVAKCRLADHIPIKAKNIKTRMQDIIDT